MKPKKRRSFQAWVARLDSIGAAQDYCFDDGAWMRRRFRARWTPQRAANEAFRAERDAYDSMVATGNRFPPLTA